MRQNVFDDAAIEFKCPKCGGAARTTLGAARYNAVVECSNGHEITIDGTQADRELQKVDQAFADLQRTISSFGR